MEKNQTSVEWLLSQIYVPHEDIADKAKEMEKKLAEKYAEFAINCDRQNMKILNYEDWVKL